MISTDDYSDYFSHPRMGSDANPKEVVLPMHGGTIPKFGKRQFRAGSSTLIPYMEFNLTESGPMPLTDVMLGPGSEPETSVEAAHSFLLSEKSNVIPQMSKAPFRPW
jgi:hypothetical protein